MTRPSPMLVAASLAALFALPASVVARTPAQILSCTGPFARSATHAGLVKAFGAANVTVQKVHVGEGETESATVIFPRDRARRVEILWRDPKRRRDLSEIRVGAGSAWRTAQGVAIGMTLSDVQTINGRPFRLYGFGWDYAGTTFDWAGGALETKPGECELQLRFETTRRTDADITGDGGFSSDDAGMRSAAPMVDAIVLRAVD